MLNLIRIISITLLLQLPLSCSYLVPTPDALDRNISLWLKDNQHDRIDNAIKSIDRTDPGYKNIISKTEEYKKAKIRYINKTSRNANQLKLKQQWQQAIFVYTDALTRIEDEPRLTKELKKLIDERDEQVLKLRKLLLLKHANALLSYDEVYDQLKLLIPLDDSAIDDIESHQNNKKNLANHLELCGEQANKDGLLQLSYDCYQASHELQPSKQKLYWSEKISKELKNQENHKRYTELLSAYQSSYNDKQYNQAKLHLDTILAINPEHKQANESLKALNTEINKLVEDSINHGKELYSQKKIKEALATWKQAKKYSPDNEDLNQLISRAEKVSKKIQSLQHSQ